MRSHTKFGRAPAPSPSPQSGALDIVDSALVFAGRREIFTADEALDLLHGVQNKVQDAPAVVIAPILTAATESYRETALVDRSRVVDPLLDMRLALSL
jgi:hypothetical protein